MTLTTPATAQTTTTSTRASTAAWAAARARVDAQLRAYRVTNDEVRARLTNEIIAEAEQQHAAAPERRADDVAAEVTYMRLKSWIDTLLGPTHESPTVRFARGRTAVFLADLPPRWPELMLSHESLPDELCERFRSMYLEAGPDLAFANMVPRPIDLGPISTVADETWRTFARWPVLRGVFLATLFLGLLGTAFYLARF